MDNEILFVQRILKSYLNGGENKILTIFSSKELNYDSALEKIFEHGLEGIAYYELIRLGILKQFPGEFIEKLKWRSRNTTIVNILLYNEFTNIIKKLHENGIDAIPVKGILFVKELYDNLGLRPMADIDFFVREDEYSRTITILKNSGYENSNFLPRRRWEQENFKIALTKLVQIPITIELHKRFAQPGRFELSHKDAFENFVSINFGGEEIKTFNSEFTFLFLIHHLGMHYFNIKLIWVADIVKFLYKVKVDWDKIIKYTDKYKLKTVLYLTLNLLSKYMEKSKLPDFHYKPSGVKRAYFDFIFTNDSLNFFRFPSLNIRLAQLIAQIPLIDSWRDRVKFLRNYIKIRVYDYL